ncbi:MAG: ABC transporter permease [Candidatus Njordarchaeales archaeon]
MFEKLIAVVVKEFKQLIRDKRTIALVIALPLSIMLLFGVAYSGNPRDVAVALAIEDSSPFSQIVVERIMASETFKVEYVLDNLETAKYYVEKGIVKASIVIPEDFSKRLMIEGKASVVLVLDPAWMNIPAAVQAEVSEIAAKASEDITRELYRRYGEIRVVSIDVVPLYVRGNLKIIDIVGPAVMGIMVQQVPLTLAAISIVREREKGTLEKLLTTPIGKLDLIFGKLIPYALVGILIGIIELYIVTEGFGAINYANLFDILIITFALALASLGIGMIFSIVSRNQLQAMQFSTFFLIMSFLFSGFLLPAEGIRPEVRVIVYLMPLYYFYDGAVGLILRGTRLKEVLFSVLQLVFYAIVTLAISFLLLSKRIE